MEEMTLEAFLDLLQAYGETTYSARELYQLGVLEEIDLIESSRPILRGSAARILHLYMKKIRQEPDLEDWSRVKNLADLYDCRTCVQHIAQVVEKGIMEPDIVQSPEGQRLVFSGRRAVTVNEAHRICRRAIDISVRLETGSDAPRGVWQDQKKGPSFPAMKISGEKASWRTCGPCLPLKRIICRVRSIVPWPVF